MNAVTTIHRLVPELLLGVLLVQTSSAAELELSRASNGASVLVRVIGADPLIHDDWSIETSTDLVTWSAADLEVVEGAWSFTPEPESTSLFFRALHLESNGAELGLYDVTTYRTLELEFEDSDWLAQMTANYGSATNVIGSLTVDGNRLDSLRSMPTANAIWLTFGPSLRTHFTGVTLSPGSRPTET